VFRFKCSAMGDIDYPALDALAWASQTIPLEVQSGPFGILPYSAYDEGISLVKTVHELTRV